jgi:hypothetical protein
MEDFSLQDVISFLELGVGETLILLAMNAKGWETRLSKAPDAPVHITLS